MWTCYSTGVDTNCCVSCGSQTSNDVCTWSDWLYVAAVAGRRCWHWHQWQWWYVSVDVVLPWWPSWSSSSVAETSPCWWWADGSRRLRQNVATLVCSTHWTSKLPSGWIAVYFKMFFSFKVDHFTVWYTITQWVLSVLSVWLLIYFHIQCFSTLHINTTSELESFLVDFWGSWLNVSEALNVNQFSTTDAVNTDS